MRSGSVRWTIRPAAITATTRGRLAGLLERLVHEMGADEGAAPMLFEEEPSGANDGEPGAARARRRRRRPAE